MGEAYVTDLRGGRGRGDQCAGGYESLIAPRQRRRRLSNPDGVAGQIPMGLPADFPGGRYSTGRFANRAGSASRRGAVAPRACLNAPRLKLTRVGLIGAPSI